MAKHGSKRQFCSEAQAQQLLKAWRDSGLSVAAFATRHGLGPERMHWARERPPERRRAALENAQST